MTGRPTHARLTPIVPWASEGSPDAHVRAEQVRVIFEQALTAQVLSVLVGVLVCYVLWQHSDHTALVVWLATLAALTIGRVVLTVQFRRHTPEQERMPAWERAFVVSLAGASLTWGVGGLVIMPPDSLAHQAFVYFFLMGIAGGSVANYSAHVTASMVAIIGIMLPATAWFAFQDVVELRAMAAGGLIYIGASYRATRTFAFFLRHSFQLSFELQQAYSRAQQLARTDVMTDLNNRRAFSELGTVAVEQARRYGRPLSLVMFDVDHFKKINDTYGHAAGDVVLRTLADAIRRTARATDISGRLGGEEFAVLLTETSATDAMTLAERLRSDVAALVVQHEGRSIRYTCSFGVAERGEATAHLDALLGEADGALYRAKAEGRDRVVLAG